MVLRPRITSNGHATEMEAELRAMKDQLREMQLDLAAMQGALTNKPCPAGFDAGMFAAYVKVAEDNKLMISLINRAKDRILEKEKLARIIEKEARIERAEAADAVTVNPPTSATPLRQPTAGTMGELPAGVTSEVDAITVSDGVLGLAELCDWRLLVRNRYYPAVWEKVAVMMRRSGTRSILVVLGQPGIGKTVGVGNYCVLRFLDAFPDGVVAIAEDKKVFRVIFTECGARKSLLFTSNDAFIDHLLRRNNGEERLLFVHDVKTSLKSRMFEVNYANLRRCRLHFTTMFTIILTSPQKANYANTRKMNMDLSYVALPTWSDDELIAGGFIAGPNDPRLALRGGIPRSYTLRDEAVIEDMRNALFSFDVAQMRQIELNAQCSSLLVQLVPIQSYIGFGMMAPVSRRAAAEIASRFGPHLHAHFIGRIGHHGSFDGHLLEWWFLSLLRAMAPMPVMTSDVPRRQCNVVLQLYSIPANTPRKLEYKHEHVHSVKSFGGSTMADLFEAIAEVVQAAGGVVGNRHHVALIPEAPNFPVVDAVVLTWRAKQARWSMVAFQCTAAASHPAAAGATEAFRKQLERAKGSITLERFVYVGLGAGGVHRGVRGEQTTKDGQPFMASQQWWMDIAEAKTK